MSTGITEFFRLTCGPDADQVGDIVHIGSSLQNHNNHGIGVGSKIAICNETEEGHTWATSVCMATGTGLVGVINSKEKQLTYTGNLQGIKTLLFNGDAEYVRIDLDDDGLAHITQVGGTPAFLTQLQQGQEIAIVSPGGTVADDTIVTATVRSVVSNSEFILEYTDDITGQDDSAPWGLGIATKIPAASFAHVNPGISIATPNGSSWIAPSPYYVWIPAAGDNLNLPPDTSEGMGGVLPTGVSHIDKTKALTAAYGWVDPGSGGGLFTPSIINLTNSQTVVRPADPFTITMHDADNAFHVGFVGPSTPADLTNKIIIWIWGQTISAKALPLYSRLMTSQASGLASSIFLGVAQGSGYHARFLQGAPMAYKTAFFSFLRQTQLEHGNDKPLILVMIESGPHTLDNAGRMSVGPNPASEDTIAGENDAVVAIIEELRGIWEENEWDITELFILLWVPADVGTSSEQYALVRAGQREVAAEYDQCDAFDIVAAGVALEDLDTLAPLNDSVHYASDSFNDWMMSKVFRHYIKVVTDPTPSLTSSGTTRVSDGQQCMTIELIRGDSYGPQSRELVITKAGGATRWPADLSEWEWALTASKHSSNTNTGSNTFTGTVDATTATGDDQAFSIAIAAEDTEDVALGRFSFDIQGTNGDERATPVTGLVTIKEDYTTG